MTPRRRRAALAVALASASFPLGIGARAPFAGATSLPPGFQESLVASGLSEPAVLAFAPDGRLFIGEKSSGKIRVVTPGVNGGLLPDPFLDVTTIVPPGTKLDSYFERGLLGIAFDPHFATNKLVYLYYSLCSHPLGDSCGAFATKNRIVRVHAAGNVVDATPPVVVIDGIDSDAGNHNGGWIDFSPADDKLYVATGDGGMFHEKSQDLGSLSGKILRLERNGDVPPDNPFAGSATERGEIWAWGLRNPWRCRFRDDGRLLCGDVGENTWEEIDVIFPTNDYGWPVSEGPFTLAQHPAFTPPISWYNHNGSNAAIMGGDFGAKTNFPGDYTASFFFGDYARGFIKRVVLDPTGTEVVGDALDFAFGVGAVTDIVVGPDKALYYTDINGGEVRKIAFASGNHSPTAVAQATPPSGSAPLTVQFSSTGTADEDGDALTFAWSFGDGEVGSGPDTSHDYLERGTYIVTLTVSDGDASPGPGLATVEVTVGSPPDVTISQPEAGTPYEAGTAIALAGSATDLEDGAIADSKLRWKIVFHHADHTHPFINQLTGSPQSFTPTDVGETDADVGYEIILSATDSDGTTTTVSRTVVPAVVDLQFKTSPPGLDVTLDGQPHTTPFTTASVVGMKRILGAPDTPAWQFASWSDGGARTHTITAPAGATTYTAAFELPPPTATPTATSTRTPTPVTTPTPLGLSNAAAARAADTCQRTITRSSLALVRGTLRQLGRCAGAIQACVQKRPGDTLCLGKAKAGCVKSLDTIQSVSATMRTAVQRQCPSVPDLTAALGLGFDAGDACGAGSPDAAAFATCLASRHRCTSERMFAMQMPRIGALLELAGVTLPAAASCLDDLPASDAHVPADDAKAVLKCMDGLGKAATAFAAARAKSLTTCAGALFTCAQRKGAADVQACLTRTDTSCGRAFAAAASDGARLRAAIDARCAETLVAFDVLRSAEAVSLDDAVANCASHGVATLGDLTAYEECVVRQHGCLAAEVARSTVPRAAELLALLGRSLTPAGCPAEPIPGPTPQ